MRKTHKKVLGFMGLGFVAATTAVAATIPSPMAAATGSAVNTISVTVMSENPDLIPSTDEGDVVTDPSYDFSVAYNGLSHVTATLKNYDEDGNVKFTAVIWDEDLDWSAGTKDFSLDLDEYGGYGDIVITFEGEGLVTVEQILSVKYVLDSRNLETDKTTGEVTTEIELPDSSVTVIETYIYSPDGSLARILSADTETGVITVYDANGSLLFTISDGYKYGELTISLAGLEYADNYTGKIVFRDASGELVGGTIVLNIKHQGEDIVVPDTGSFFQGLNISREDYLITGLIAFMVIGVVAFGIVMKGRSNDKSGRINGKNRR